MVRNAAPGNASRPAGPLEGRRERKRAETRERIFGAALSLFADKGFAATTVEDITQLADVGKGTFFNYFPTKEHVLAFLAETQVSKVHQALEQVRSASRPPEALIRELAYELVKNPSRSPQFVRSLILTFLGTSEARYAMQRQMEIGRGKLAEIFEMLQQRGEIRPDAVPLVLARTFQQSVLGTLLLWSLNPQGPVREMLDPALDVFWRGVRTGGNSSERSPKVRSTR
ncbi:MAG TPA: TetR/AcrR family transcriptional regulator [Clostridia bacterium]|nr:TetR/AcrR family transcriptional regulator [Clostridia bacterium]